MDENDARKVAATTQEGVAKYYEVVDEEPWYQEPQICLPTINQYEPLFGNMANVVFTRSDNSSDDFDYMINGHVMDIV